MVALVLRRGPRAADRVAALARGVVGLSLLCGFTGFIAGCGGGNAVAPVLSPTEAAIPGRGHQQHVVGKGETLYSIAWRLGIDYRVLAGVNSIRDPYTIYPGQRLLVPEPGAVVPPESEPEPAPESEPEVVAGEPSVQGAGTTQTPVVTPLPPSPESKPAAAGPPPEPPVARKQSAAEPAARPLAARTVAGLKWTRPTVGKTISTFGRGGNKGIDVEGTFEQPIRAAARGRVVYAGSGLIGYGKLVIVKHSGRLLSAYAHNDRLHVGEGDEVKGGQRIADMGRSSKGRVMLHFEIRRDGKPVDPLQFLP